jgi:hypothetical protein
MRIRALLGVCASLFLAGCAPVQSVKLATAAGPAITDASGRGHATGLVYHLPLMDFVLSVTVLDGGKKPTPKVTLSDPYPDLSSAYVLLPGRSQGTNANLDLGVDTNGLLTSTSITTTSAVGDILKNLAATVAVRNAQLLDFSLIQPESTPPKPATPVKPCMTAGTYVSIVSLRDFRNGVQDFCGVTFRLDQTLRWTTVMAPADQDKVKARVYYRQLRPVRIIATLDENPQEHVAYLLLVPDPDQVSALAVPRTFFADNTTTMTFKNGMPTEYKPQANSEVLGALKMPADVIGAYFAAFGQVFSAFGDAKGKEAAAAKASVSLQAQQYKDELCLQALAAKDDHVISATCPSN